MHDGWWHEDAVPRPNLLKRSHAPIQEHRARGSDDQHPTFQSNRRIPFAATSEPLARIGSIGFSIVTCDLHFTTRTIVPVARHEHEIQNPRQEKKRTKNQANQQTASGTLPWPSFITTVWIWTDHLRRSLLVSLQCNPSFSLVSSSASRFGSIQTRQTSSLVPFRANSPVKRTCIP